MKKQPSPTNRRTASLILATVVGLLIFSAGIVTGRSYEVGRHRLNLSQFWNALDHIEEQYVGSINRERAVEGATRGLVESLEDPYSGYLTKKQREELDTELKGEFEGIGAELTTKNSFITVVSPISNSPAEKAGLKANDIIIRVDGQETTGMSLSQVVDKIRGPKGSTVKLTIARESRDEPVELEITRENIKVESVTSRMIGNIGYLEIRQFGDDTVSLAKSEVEALQSKQPKAVIVDVRNNPGGYLNSVPLVAGLFLPPSVVVIQKSKNGEEQALKSRDVPVMPNTPLYVLVNEGSASAAEILAGALQDYGRAKLVGRKTFGKGSVQDLIPLSDGSALRLTVAEWLTPKKRSINKNGIEPDVVVEGEKTATEDPVLQKALELARSA